MDNNRQRDLLQEFVNNPVQRGLNDSQLKESFESTVAACEDQFNIYVEVKDDKVSVARWEGAGCAISAGATEAILRAIEGKTTKEVEQMLSAFEKLISGEIKESNIEELDVFEIIQSHVSRKKCALAPIGAIRKAIK